jgi:RNase P subunit RPR2
MKTCYKCKRDLPLTSFYKNKARPDGRNTGCKDCHKKENIEYRQRHPEAQYEHIIKIEVFTHYSGGTPKCKRCGFDDIRALTMDHINGDGYIQRKEIKRGGSSFYLWARENGYPDDLQVLCHNCQWIKRHENGEHRGRANKK